DTSPHPINPFSVEPHPPIKVNKSCASDKAPGPDDFSFSFFKHFWSLIKDDVCVAVWDFQTRAVLPRMVKSTFVVLIPKKEAVGDIKDMRPISLIGGVYKIISKCLLHIFKATLEVLVSPHQCAFTEKKS
ncbi:Transposon TX1 uncharacterized 149 kDa protein, partial [Linum perenne]